MPSLKFVTKVPLPWQVCVKAVSEPAEKPEPAAEMRGREELAALPVRERKRRAG
jgi:hypothetical protein